MDTPSPQDDELDLAVRVRADQLHLLYQQSFPAIFLSVVVAAVLCQMLWDGGRHALLIGWLALIGAGGFMRWALFWLHRRRRPEGLQILDWERSYAVTLFITTSLWGLGVLWISIESTLVEQLVSFMFLLGMAAGAFSHYSARRYMVVGAMGSILLPTIGLFLLSGQSMKLSLGVAALLYMGLLVRASTVLSRAQGENFALTHRLSAAKQKAELMAQTDELTGLDNRRAFFARGQTLANYCQRNKLPLSIAMIDADYFKQINDQHGHAVGDAVLCGLADLLRRSLRKSDVCGRMGGEEFAILLPDTSLLEATELAERFCRAYEATPTSSGGIEVRNTVSVGVACDGYDIEQLLQSADEALYLAKAAGRNRVVSELNVEAALA
ncbi:MAG: diguanylate cyclase [Azonexaceae bacterium]|nr:diguanylate cyclase [Azonexaceae bacterium]